MLFRSLYKLGLSPCGSTQITILHSQLFRSFVPPKAHEMVSADAARNIVGIIGNVISFGLFLSPV